MTDNVATDATKRKKCECNFCTLRLKIASAKRRGTREDLISLVDELSEKYWNTEFDLDYLNAIMDGSWPSAVEQLESAFERAKARVATPEPTE